MDGKKKCEECDGNGVIISNWDGVIHCFTCSGTGYIEEEPTSKTYFPNCS
jgi:DnaJ-class molecular chaperone